MIKIKFEYKLTAIYLITGVVWILFSDKLLLFFIKDSTVLTELQTYKGWVYVIITSCLLYVVLKIHLVKIYKAEQKAKESDRLKSAFLANMSHEIRTPMNGILGFSELLKTPGLTGDQQQEYINFIKKSGERMLTIIGNIVDLSKIESGHMKTFISSTNINEQIEFIYTIFKPEVEQKGMQLVFYNGLTEKESIIQTDSEKIFAILSNLLKNAVKFSIKGSIEFGYNVRPAENILNGKNTKTFESEPAEMVFYVKDNGIGIPHDRQTAIFDRFIQADILDIQAFQGAGLGLSIAKAYVEMLGGKIHVESEVGKGSVFYFTIPYNPKSNEKTILKKTVGSY